MKITRTILNSLVAGAFLIPVVASAAMSPLMPMPDPMPMPPPMMDGIVYDRSDFVFGFTAFKDPFYIHDAGVYQATLTDFEFPNEFEYIGLMITQGSTSKMGEIEGSGSFTFDADPGMYNVFFVGSVGDTSMMKHGHGGHDMMMPLSPVASVGTYGIQVAMVPELETWLMMSAGLLGMGYVLRRQNRRPSHTGLRLRLA